MIGHVLSQTPQLCFDGVVFGQRMSYHRYRSCVLTVGRYGSSCPITDTAAVFWRRCVWTAHVLSQAPQLCFDGGVFGQLMSYHRYHSCVLTAMCLDSSCPITGTVAVFWRWGVMTTHVLSHTPQLCFDGSVFGQSMSYHRHRSCVLTIAHLVSSCPITGTAAVIWRLHILSAPVFISGAWHVMPDSVVV